MRRPSETGQLKRRAADDAGARSANAGARTIFEISKFRAEQLTPLAQFRPYLMGANLLAVLAVTWISREYVSGP
ncbi:MAG: hypothetical protein E6G87_07110, partial [Alphaproteobacteria bacterium]